MKKEYSFEIHRNAPELNKAYINGYLLKGYTPKYASSDGVLIRELRQWQKQNRTPVMYIKWEHTGATKGLPDDCCVIACSGEQRRLFIKWLKGKSKGKGVFLQSDGTYQEKEYGFKIVLCKYH